MRSPINALSAMDHLDHLELQDIQNIPGHTRFFHCCPGCGLLTMDRASVRSSNIVSVGWEADEEGGGNGILEVEFKAGVIYQYTDVPEATYRGLIGAASPGKYLLQNIVDAYDGQRIE